MYSAYWLMVKSVTLFIGHGLSLLKTLGAAFRPLAITEISANPDFYSVQIGLMEGDSSKSGSASRIRHMTGIERGAPTTTI